MSAAKIRGFLLQKPKPSSVRLTGEGEPEVIKVGRSYSKLADTIEALDVDLIECLDASGAVLRAMRLSSADTQRSDAAEIPAVIATDPNAAMLTLFANLIHRAYEHSTETAFQKLVEMMDRHMGYTESVEARLAATDNLLRRTQREQIEAELDRVDELAAKAAAGEGGGLGEQMLQSFIGARMNGAGVAPKSKGAG